MHLKKFDQPHQHIHAIAIEVEKLMAQGLPEKVQDVIDGVRNRSRGQLLRLFAELRSIIRESNREIALVVNAEGKNSAIPVDSPQSVEKMQAGSIEKLQSGLNMRSIASFRGSGKEPGAGKSF